MYPLEDEELSLAELADLLSGGREQAGVQRRRLVAAILRGQLLSRTTPEALLRSAHVTKNHPGLQFCDTAPPETVKYEADGTVTVDLTVYIPWCPEQLSDKRQTERALDLLSRVDFVDYSNQMKSGLLALKISRKEYQDYCELANKRLPDFWFDKPHRPLKARAAAGCSEWLAELARLNGPRPAAREEILKKAKALFKGLTQIGFRQCWDKTPESWRKGGAPTRHRNPVWPTGRFGSYIV